MEEIIKQALKILKEDPTLKEVELWDKACGEKTQSVRLVRDKDVIKRSWFDKRFIDK